MGFQLIGYEVLKGRIEQGITSLLDASKLSSLPREETIKQLGERKGQVIFLQVIIGLLTKMEYIEPKESTSVTSNSTELPILTHDRHKGSILNAATFLIITTIRASYSYFSPKGSLLNKGSDFLGHLETALGITEKNTPTSNDIRNMYQTLKVLLLKQIYVSGDPAMGIVENHPFDGIPDKIFTRWLNSLDQQLTEATKNLTEAASAVKKTVENKEKKPSGWLMPGFWTTWTNDDVVNEDDIPSTAP